MALALLFFCASIMREFPNRLRSMVVVILLSNNLCAETKSLLFEEFYQPFRDMIEIVANRLRSMVGAEVCLQKLHYLSRVYL